MRLNVLTYNIHGCVGLDRRCSPERIAEVIAQSAADVVALQEVDVGRPRSANENQPEVIGNLLNMRHSFYATIRHGNEQYGGALLSRLPLEPVKVGVLPGRPHLEPRGALWGKIDADGTPINVVTTHLGLRPFERKEQVDMLLGPEWLYHKDFTTPSILCGDLNLTPFSPLCRRLGRCLHDVRRLAKRPYRHGTFLGLFAIDHIFVSNDFELKGLKVLDDRRARLASDHLPLLAELELGTQAVATRE
jgi:endonuclease/exonuclease/phosphatase family metal-dependent hydrolase